MNEIVRFFPQLLSGLGVTMELVVTAAPAGFLIGICVALAEVYGGPLLAPFAYTYQILFRGTPLLLQLFVIYYGLPHAGIVLSPLAAAIAGFSLCSGAYHSEYMRGALLSIPHGQWEAARALGLGRLKTIAFVIIPQMVRRALPGSTNEFIYLIKYSSLAYLVTVIELTGEGRLIAYKTFRFFDAFLVVGLIYLGLVSLAARGLEAIEHKLEIPSA